MLLVYTLKFENKPHSCWQQKAFSVDGFCKTLQAYSLQLFQIFTYNEALREID